MCSRFLLVLSLLLFVGSARLDAQANVDNAIAKPNGGNYLPVRFGQVNLDTGDLSLSFPLNSYPAANGMAGGYYSLEYHSSFWSGDFVNGNGIADAYPVGAWTVTGHFPGSAEIFNTDSVQKTCPYQGSSYQNGNQATFTISSYFGAIDDADNSAHYFFIPSGVMNGACYDQYGNVVPTSYPTSGTALDSEGYSLTVGGYGSGTLTRPDGNSTHATTNGNLTIGALELLGFSTPENNSLDYLYHDNTGRVVQPTYSDSCSGPPSANNGGAFYANEPYSPQSDYTCTLTSESLDGTPGTIAFVIDFTYIPVCTSFKASNAATNANIIDYCGGMWTVGGLTTPTEAYKFTYDQGQSAPHYGQLTGITLPTAGQISYTYTSPEPQKQDDPYSLYFESVTDNGGTTSIDYSRGTQAVTPINLLGQSGTVRYPITITYPPHNTSTQAAAISDTTVFSYVRSSSAATLIRDDYAGASSLIVETQRDYVYPAIPSFIQTTWMETGDTFRTDYSYVYATDISGSVSDKKETLNGALYRSTHIDYLQDTANTPYVSAYHMVNYPVDIIVKDANNNRIAETDLAYDEYSANFCSSGPVGQSGVPTLSSINGGRGHDDSGHGTSWVARGNVTTMARWISGNAFAIEHRCYDTLGNVTQIQDGNGNPTQYGYVENAADASCPTPSNYVNASESTLTTNALGQQTTISYGSCSRRPAYVSNPNDKAAKRLGSWSTFDSAGRPRCQGLADGGSTCRTYFGSSNEYEDLQLINAGASQTHIVATALDAFGNIGSVYDYPTEAVTAYTYDLFGRIATTTLPSAGSSAPQTHKFYDVLGRPSAYIAGDGISTTRYVYTGPNVDIYEPGGTHRYLKYNALNQLIHIDELGTQASPMSIGTDYAYDFMGNLSGVTQGANTPVPRVRSFFYDGLSRLYFSSNPETGSICYGQTGGATPTQANCDRTTGYDGNGNLRSKTFASLKTTQTQYDALNRPLSKQYSDGTPTSCFQYDTSVLANANSNTVGQLTNTWTQLGSCLSPSSSSSFTTPAILSRRSILQYDPVGRVIQEQQCTFSNCKTGSYAPSYTYNYVGGVTNQTDGAGHVNLSAQYDMAGRIFSLTGNAGQATQLLSKPVYFPAGMLNSLVVGTGLSRTRTYDLQYRPLTETDSSGVQPGTPGAVSISITGVEQVKQ